MRPVCRVQVFQRLQIGNGFGGSQIRQQCFIERNDPNRIGIVRRPGSPQIQQMLGQHIAKFTYIVRIGRIHRRIIEPIVAVPAIGSACRYGYRNFFKPGIDGRNQSAIKPRPINLHFPQPIAGNDDGILPVVERKIQRNLVGIVARHNLGMVG